MSTDPFSPEEQEGPRSALRLADDLRRILSSSFKPDLEVDSSIFTKEIQLYHDIAEGVGKNRGFGNLVLQDTAYRLAILRLADWLVARPSDIDAIAKAASTIEVRSVIVRDLLAQLGKQDKELESIGDRLWQIDESQDIFASFQTVGIGADRVLMAIDIPEQATSNLLRSSSVVTLIHRMATTEALAKAYLPGMIDFVRKGGAYKEIDPRDIRPFQHRMGQDAKIYRYPLLQVRAFSTTQAQFILDLHDKPLKRGTFLRVAVE